MGEPPARGADEGWALPDVGTPYEPPQEPVFGEPVGAPSSQPGPAEFTSGAPPAEPSEPSPFAAPAEPEEEAQRYQEAPEALPDPEEEEERRRQREEAARAYEQARDEQ